MRTCKVGIGREAQTDLLVIHPRNNNDSLLIVLDELGQTLRMALIEIKAWVNLYDYIFAGSYIKGSLAHSYTAIDLSDQPKHMKFELTVSEHTPPTDGLILRTMIFKADSLISINLNGLQFSNDGASRFSELISSSRKLEEISLESNYLDELSCESIIEALDDVVMLNLTKIRFVNIKLGDSLSQQLLDMITEMKSYNNSKPLKELTLSKIGVTDSGLLGFHTLLARYVHPKPGFALDLSHNMFTQNTLVMLGELIAKYQVVWKLNLSYSQNLEKVNNSIKSLLESLFLNKVVAEIDFRGNTCSRFNYKSIIKFLGNNHTIQRIHLDLNQEELSKFIKSSKFPPELDVFRFNINAPPGELYNLT